MFRRSALIVALMLVVSACGNTATDDPGTTSSLENSTTSTSSASSTSSMGSTTTSSVSTTASSTTTSTLGAPVYTLDATGIEVPTVEVLEAGAEPRTVLMFSPMAGDVSHNEVVLEFSTAQELNNTAPVGSDLSLRITTRNTVLELNADGFVVEVTAIGADVQSSNSDVVEALEPLYAFLPGISTYSQTSPSGAYLAEDNSQMASFIDASGQDLGFSPGDLVSPFPDTPVGVGARWVVTAMIVEEFVAVEQQTVYELVAREGELVTLAVTVEQTLLNLESLGVGLENPQVAYIATGSGDIVINLSVATPLEASLTLTQRIVIEGEADGEDVSVITTNVVSTTSTTTEITTDGS